MATSTVQFSGQLTATSLGEGYVDLPFVPPSNISGKLCYVKANAFNFSPTYSGKLGWQTFELYADGWSQVQTAAVDWNPDAGHSGNFSCTTTNGSAELTGVSVAYGMVAGSRLYGSGVSSGQTVVSVSGSTITMSAAATSTGTPTVTYFNDANTRQTTQVPLASNNDYSLNSYPVLCQIPDGPHTIRFRVKRADNGHIISSLLTGYLNFAATFSIVPANSRPTPLN